MILIQFNFRFNQIHNNEFFKDFIYKKEKKEKKPNKDKTNKNFS